MKQKVLIFSPTSFWVCHILFERLLAKKMIEQDHSVRIIYCDKVLDICDVQNKCLVCRVSQMRIDKELEITSEPMGSLIHYEETNLVISSMENLTDLQLLNFSYENLELSKIVESSFFSYFRTNRINLENPAQRKGYINFLKGAVLTANVLRHVMDEYRPDVVFTFNGRYFPQQIAFEMGMKRGIRVFTHEIGMIADSMLLSKNAKVHGYEKTLSDWNRVKNQPLKEEELLYALKIANEWSIAKGKAGKIYVDPKSFYLSVDKIASESKQYKKTVLFLTSSIDEIAALDGFKEIFESQNQWLEDSIDYLIKHPDVFGIIRFHPNTISKQGKILETLDFIDGLKKRNLPKNILIIHPETKINTYKLMKISDAGVTYGSTTSIEMAMMRKRVLIARECVYYFLDFFKNVKSKLRYHQDLDDVLSSVVNQKDYANVLRFFYFYTKSLSIPFPFIKYIKDTTSFINFLDYQQIKNEKILQELTDYILHDKEFNQSVPDYNNDDENKIVSNIHLINRASPRKVMIFSSMKKHEFWQKNNFQYGYYKKLITKYGNIPDVVFFNDEDSIREKFSEEGGYNGFFSSTYKIYYRSLFRFPYLVKVNYQFRRMFFWMLAKFSTKEKMVKAMYLDFDPHYIINFINDPKICLEIENICHQKRVFHFTSESKEIF